jgi:hypothetical protein
MLIRQWSDIFAVFSLAYKVTVQILWFTPEFNNDNSTNKGWLHTAIFFFQMVYWYEHCQQFI